MLVLLLLVGARILSRYTRLTPWIYRACWFVAGIGWLSFRAGIILENELPVAQEMQPVVITGVIASLPTQTDRYTQFHFDIEDARTQQDDPFSFNARIRLRWYGQTPELSAGEQWRLNVKMKRPHGFQNPGGFDYEAWLLGQRLRATGYVLDEEDNVKISPAAASDVVSSWRSRIIQSIRKTLPDDSMRGIIIALAVGDRAEISDEMWQVFRRTGTNHLIAISGLHIGLVSGLMMLLASLTWRWRGRPVLWLPAPKFAVLCGLLAAVRICRACGLYHPDTKSAVDVDCDRRRGVVATAVAAISGFVLVIVTGFNI